MQISKNLTDAETLFNVAGSVPIVGAISGALRVVAGKVQMIAGAVIGLVALGAQIIHKDSRKWEVIAHKGLQNFIHGYLNTVRGAMEAFLGATVVGSLVPLALQIRSENKFAPIVKYNNLDEAPLEIKV